MKNILFAIAFLIIMSFSSLSAKEPTNIMIGFGIGAGKSAIDINYAHASRFPLEGVDPNNPRQPLWGANSNSSISSWALAWEFLVGYKHFINDWVGFRYYANVGIQHYTAKSLGDKSQKIGFVDYTLNADLLIDFWESEFFAIGMFGGLGFGGTSFDKKAIVRYMAIYDRDSGRPIGLANVNKHFVNVNASVGARMTIFQKIRRPSARVCDEFVNGKRVCRVPIYYIGHGIEFSAKFPLMDYRATPLPDIIQVNGGYASRPEYVVKNPYRLTIRYVVDF